MENHNSDRFDIINRDRFLDAICGDTKVELGIVTGNYRNQPCELLVIVLDSHDEDINEGDDVTVVPLAAFLSEEDLSYIDIPFGADVETIEFEEREALPMQPHEEEEEEEEPEDTDTNTSKKRTIH